MRLIVIAARRLTIAALAALAAGTAAANASGANGADAEARLLAALERIGRGESKTALGELEDLVARYPNFRLAHLVRGDLLLARARPIGDFGSTGHAARERLEELRAEALARQRARKERPNGDLVPRYLLRLDPSQKHVLVVDGSRSRLYLYENASGAPRLVLDYYTTLGKRGIAKEREGDQKTPIGVYRVTTQIPGSKLPDLYGWGALPLSYPNEWDRLRGRTGYGIWIHGVPSDTYARAPQASDGCIALANPEIEDLAGRVRPGATPVVVAESVEWVAPVALRAERDDILRHLETWRADWESRDTERYLVHYARTFRSAGMDLEAWRAHKLRVNAGKSWIKVSLGGLTVIRVPGERDLIEVTFEQDYRSSNLSQRTRKRQYWVREDGRWKIAYEAPVGTARLILPESYRRAGR
jgi:murein L,D-transpeptidase YafK